MIADSLPRSKFARFASLPSGSARAALLGVLFGLLCSWSAIADAQDALEPPRLNVESDFPGGSIKVRELDNQRRFLSLLPAKHDQKGWRCWWYCKISGLVVDEMLTVEVGEAPWATPQRAAISTDKQHWSQTEPGHREGKTITYRIKCPAESIFLAWGPPFVPSAAEALVKRASQQPFCSSFVLTKSRQGQEVLALRVHEPTDDQQRENPPYGIWIQARQHAWEAGSSWVCQGLLEWLMSNDSRAQRLRREAIIYVVPIVDLDSVALGAGGKNQHPHDHNRDWSDSPHWPETAAAMSRIAKLDEQHAFDLFIDLHNPGASAQEPFYFITPRDLLTDQGSRNLDRFLAASREDITGPLAYLGRTIESGANYDKAWQRISKNWVNEHTREHVVALTLETAWNTPHSTTAGYQQVGAGLGQAIERYFRFEPRQ